MPVCAHPAPRSRTPRPAAHPLVVLVVDAYPDAAESTALLLSLCGHVTHTAECERTAVDQAVRHRPDVLVLDIPLPDGDGYALLRAVTTALGYRPRTVVITAWDGLEERSRDAGCEHHLVKPASPVEIMALLEWYAAEGP
jgi:CheY-like chemotaxis protein